MTVLEGATFCVSDEAGDIAAATHGFFTHDTRFLSRLRVTIDGESPLLLASRTVEYFAAVAYLRNPVTADLQPDEVLVRRERYVSDHLHERIAVTNTSRRELHFRLALELDADFADILSVKTHDLSLGDPDRTAPLPEPAGPELLDARRLILTPHEKDIETLVAFSRDLRLERGRILFDLVLAGQAEWDVQLTVYPLTYGERPPLTVARHTFGEERSHIQESLRAWQLSVPAVRAPRRSLRATFERSVTDLASLRMQVGETGQGLLPAAGLPWFMTVFGRDTLITCLQTLMLGQDLARSALEALAELQSTVDDASIDAEPGKIVHELREGRCAEVWYPRYYGTVDATPLFVILLSETWRWTGDDDLVRRMRQPALRAIEWIDRYGDRDGDGFVEYERRSPGGLVNQSWKDSGDSQRFADGTIAEPPIAPCEVQGYVFDAKLRAAEMAVAVWRDRSLAARLEHEAVELCERFDRHFWVPRGRYYALALDGQKRPVDSLCSNIGHLLWSGIVPADRVDDVADRLFEDRLWSGWGVRTMSSGDVGYGPLAYHNGTVWPHDNSLIAWGLQRAGREMDSRRICETMLEAATHFAGTLPEVFTGLARSQAPFPVPYPAAARPQAWAAATPILLQRVLLGLEPDRGRMELVSRISQPLPSWLDGMSIRGIPAFGQQWDAVVEAGRVHVERSYE
jgi:glycogen debranching enzyme